MNERPAASAPGQEPDARLSVTEVRSFAARLDAEHTNTGRARLLRELASRIRAAE